MIIRKFIDEKLCQLILTLKHACLTRMRYGLGVGVALLVRVDVNDWNRSLKMPLSVPLIRPACIAIDLDCTLAYFKGGYESLFACFAEYGVDAATAQECYKQTKCGGGFSVLAMVAKVSARTGITLDSARLEDQLLTWLKGSIAPYPESRLKLTEWQEHGIPVVIVTAGDVQYQTEKVLILQLPHNELIVVTSKDEKPSVMRKLLIRYGCPILFIDDCPATLDLTRSQGLTEHEVMTIRLARPESPYYSDQSTSRHCALPSLNDIAILVESPRYKPN